jgi:hypothetical protein
LRTGEQRGAERLLSRAILLTSWITPSTDALSQIGMQSIALLRKPAPDGRSTVQYRGVPGSTAAV